MNASANNLPLKQQMTSSGFTLIELMVTIAVLAIIVSIAAPSISTQLANQRVKSTAATLANALKEAKSESIIRRQDVELSIDNNALTIEIENLDEDEDEIASYNYSANNTIEIDEDTDAVIFRPDKRADAVIYTVCDSKNSSSSMQVIVTAIASISVVTGGTC